MTNFDELLPVYHISGDDGYFIHETLQQIEDACENNLGDLNKAIFDDENFDADKIIASTQQLPIMAKRRLVVIKNMLKVKDGDLKKLDQYCKEPATETCLVFVENPNQSLFSKLKAQKIVCKKLSSSQLEQKILDELKRYNKQIQNEASLLLIDYCSRDFLRIKTELSKLVYASQQNLITKQDVQNLVHKNDDYSVFEITSALTKGDADRGIVLMQKMLQNYDFPFILSLIHSNFRRMFYITLSNESNAEIAQKLGFQENAIAILRSRTKAIKPMQIIKINELILDVDYSIKMGKMATENAMFYLVFKMVEIIKGELK